MTQEEKQLLLKDLCARLPYGVNGLITAHITMSENSTFNRVIDGKLYDRFANLQDSWYDNIPSIKPYLRPMSSMTEEEEEEWNSYISVPPGKSLRRTPYCIKYMDWLLEHHFDFIHLIEKGLALKAPEGMYTKEDKICE